MDPNTTLAIIALVAAALLIDMAMPQRGTHSWDNKRAATQRDVADVFKGRVPCPWSRCLWSCSGSPSSSGSRVVCREWVNPNVNVNG